MPRRFNRRSRFRRPRRRRRFRRRRRTMRRRRAVLDPERKLIPLAVENLIDFDGITYFLNGAAQGITQTNRIGFQQLTVSSLIAYRLTIDPANTVPTVVRVSLIQFKQPAGLPLLIPNIYDAGGTVFAANGHRNILNALQYKVLWTRKHMLDLAHQVVNRTVFKPLRLVTRYSAAGGALGDVQTGGLWLIVISDQAAAPLPLFQIVSRTRFVG